MRLAAVMVWKELVQVANRRWFALQKAAIAVIVAALFVLMAYGMIYSEASGATFEKMATFGRGFFWAAGAVLTVVLGLSALVTASGIVVSEHVHKRLALLLVTPLSAAAIMGAKAMSVFVRAGVGLVVGLPVFAMLMVFGGVDRAMIVTVLAFIAANVWLYASIGLFSSVVGRKTVTALVWAAVISLAWNVVALVYYLVVVLILKYKGPEEYFYLLSPFYTYAMAIAGSFGAPVTVSPQIMTFHVCASGILGALFLTGSFMLFRPLAARRISGGTARRRGIFHGFWKPSDAESVPRTGSPTPVPGVGGPSREGASGREQLSDAESVPRTGSPTSVPGIGGLSREGASGREQSLDQKSRHPSKLVRMFGNGMIAKELASWRPWKAAWSMTWFVIVYGVVALVSIATGEWPDFGNVDDQQGLFMIEQAGFLFLLSAQAAVYIAREREARTLPVLVLTRLGRLRILGGKAAALLIRQAPGVIFLILHLCLILWMGFPLRLLSWMMLPGLFLLITFSVALGFYYSLCSKRVVTAVVLTALTWLFGPLAGYLLLQLGLFISRTTEPITFYAVWVPAVMTAVAVVAMLCLGRSKGYGAWLAAACYLVMMQCAAGILAKQGVGDSASVMGETDADFILLFAKIAAFPSNPAWFAVGCWFCALELAVLAWMVLSTLASFEAQARRV